MRKELLEVAGAVEDGKDGQGFGVALVDDEVGMERKEVRPEGW